MAEHVVCAGEGARATRSVDAAQRALAADRPAHAADQRRARAPERRIIAERNLLGLAELAAIVRDESDQRLPATARAALVVLVRRIEMVSAGIAALDSTLRKENRASELGPRLETIPSVGPIIASALRTRVTDAALFENGRNLSAWIVSCRRTIRLAARSGKMGFPRRVIAICAHYSSRV